MKTSYLAGMASAAALLVAAPAQAREPSAHVRCDGNPDNVGAGETAARLIGAVTLLGLFAPPPEAPNQSARLSGAEGAAVCTQALDGESNSNRRVRLILARAIHHIEAGDHEAAIRDAQLATTDRPDFASGRDFQLSLRLSALEIEAMALLGAGRTQEAVAKAIEMADLAPYDLLNQLRAFTYVRLSGDYGPAESVFFERLIRIYPAALTSRAAAREEHGDFRGAADDYELWVRYIDSMVESPAGRSHGLAAAALDRALAGEADRAAALAEQAQAALTAASGQGRELAGAELLDLYRILRLAGEGRSSEARLLFGGRSAWTRPSPAVTAQIAGRLRDGAAESERLGLLAGDPAAILTAALDERLRSARETKDRYGAIRAILADDQLTRFANNVWRTERSRYAAGNEDARTRARLVNVTRDGFGTAAGYALLLHSALLARQEGKSAFMLMPLQQNLSAHMVRFGNPGDEGLFPEFTYDAATVIRELGPLIPRPQPQRRR